MSNKAIENAIDLSFNAEDIPESSFVEKSIKDIVSTLYNHSHNKEYFSQFIKQPLIDGIKVGDALRKNMWWKFKVSKRMSLSPVYCYSHPQFNNCMSSSAFHLGYLIGLYHNIEKAARYKVGGDRVSPDSYMMDFYGNEYHGVVSSADKDDVLLMRAMAVVEDNLSDFEEVDDDFVESIVKYSNSPLLHKGKITS